MMEKSEYIQYGEEMANALKEHFRQLVEDGPGYLYTIGKGRIAEMLGVDPSSVTRQLKPMDQRGNQFDIVHFFAYSKLAGISPLEVLMELMMNYEIKKRIDQKSTTS